MKVKHFTYLLACLFSMRGYASVQTDLGDFFDGMGYASNVTQAKAWQGQSAGYITGGSMYMRTPVKSIQLASVELPSITAGCGGIDAYFGSFSVISGSEIQAFAKSIMSNAKGYMFDLALTTTVPEMASVKNYLQKYANDINDSNISSCQAAQGIVGGLWPRTQVSQQKVCQDIAGQDNIFADWAASKKECTVGGQQDAVNNTASKAQKDQVIKNKNITWDTLKKNRLFSGDDKDQLREFVMSLVGSRIFKSDSNGKQITINLTPMVDRDSIIAALMYGGDKQAEVYDCIDEDLCLNVKPSKLKISSSSALVSRVLTLINSIQQKIIADNGSLTSEEKGFINTTSVPVLKYLTVSQSLGMDPIYLTQMSDYIARDILLRYIGELIDQFNMAVASGNYTEPVAEELRANAVNAMDLLHKMKIESVSRQQELANLERNISYLQQQLSTVMLTNYQANYKFGGQ